MSRTRLTSVGRWLMPFLVACGIVAGCALPATPPAPPAGVPAGATQPPTATVQPTRAPTVEPSPVALRIEPIPNPFERRQLPAGEPIAQAGDAYTRQGGMFFMQVATGEVEAWTLPGAEQARYDTGPDNRWVTAYTPEATYLADRRSDAAYRWAPFRGGVDKPRLLVAQGDDLLFVEWGQVWLAGPGHPAPVALPIHTTGPDAPWPVISPDGQAAAILVGRTLYLVQLDEATCRTIGTVADSAGGTVGIIWMSTGRAGAEIVAAADLQQGSGPERRTARLIERYSWQGERLGEVTVPGVLNSTPLSADGRWLAWEERVSELNQAVVVADAATLAPRFRVPGASLCFHDHGGGEWLADGSGLIVRTEAGYRIVSLDGQFAPAPTYRGPAGEPMPFPDEPLPAPDRSDLFAIGRRAVVDAAGRPVAVAALCVGSGLGQPDDLDPWGLDSSELRFALPHGGHGGHCGDWEYMLPARVEWAPFSPLALAVGLPAGECADLRTAPGAGGEVLACLAGGTRLSPAPLAEPQQFEGDVYSLTASIAWAGGTWLHVRAPGGQEGWVDADAAQVGWAP